MKKICIITQSHLAFNPRVVKEANSLQSFGYDVVVLTAFSAGKALQIDRKLNQANFRYEAAVNLLDSSLGGAKTFIYRLTRKAGIKLFEYLKINSPYSIMYGPYDMLKEAKVCNADLYIGHTEAGLWVCNKLAKEGHTVAYDFEDWYSHDYIRNSRPVEYLKKLESFALSAGRYVTCPSQAMATSIGEFYQKHKPHVIFNGFSQTESVQAHDVTGVRKSSERISFMWFSQTIGPGRGLETIIEALNSVNFNYEFHLRGNCADSYKELLLEMHQPKEGQELLIHPLVPHHELIAYISEHDVGLALELDYPKNKDLTISNKILQYLQGGLTVISSETKGQNEVAALSKGNVFLFKNNDSASLTGVLQMVNSLFEQEHLKKENSIHAYLTHFAWETQEKKLLSLVADALK